MQESTSNLAYMRKAGLDLIGLSGYAGSGKDEAGYVLEELGYEKVSFAGPLKQAIYTLNPIVADRSDRSVQDVIDEFGWDDAKRMFPELRRLLQAMGTEVGRNMFGSNFWVDLAFKNIKEGKKYVFTDCRFLNEALAIKECNGSIIRITRSGNEPVNPHISEVALNGYDFDGEIINDGTLFEFHQKVLELVS